MSGKRIAVHLRKRKNGNAGLGKVNTEVNFPEET
jgi:hypothetical protein